jgi:hypothetical protein
VYVQSQAGNLGVEAEIVTLPRPSTRQYKWDERTCDRLDKLAELLPTKSEVEILRDAIGSFLSQLERDERVSMTVPSEHLPPSRRAHKRGGRAG